jgi:RimJ/RimL family protein N-acetyltransferase
MRLEARGDAMTFRIEPLADGTLEELATWRYEPPYDFYNGDEDPPKNPERFFEARDDDGRLVGFLYFDERGDLLEYGLGLHPDLTGHGLGLELFLAGLEFGRDRFRPRQIVLNVAEFNERAIRVYERASFRATGRPVRKFARWGDLPFIEMEEQR